TKHEQRGEDLRRGLVRGLEDLGRDRHRHVPDPSADRRRLPVGRRVASVQDRAALTSSWRTQSVTSRETRVTRNTLPRSASRTVNACGSPTEGERSPKPSVVRATKLK